MIRQCEKCLRKNMRCRPFGLTGWACYDCTRQFPGQTYRERVSAEKERDYPGVPYISREQANKNKEELFEMLKRKAKKMAPQPGEITDPKAMARRFLKNEMPAVDEPRVWEVRKPGTFMEKGALIELVHGTYEQACDWAVEQPDFFRNRVAWGTVKEAKRTPIRKLGEE